MRLLVNADDFGYSLGQNYGIIDAFVNGIVRSASLMAPAPAAGHAVQLAGQHPELGVGVHLILDFGRPILAPELIPSLIGAEGFFIRHSLDAALPVKITEVELEWRAQINSVISRGIRPTHLDGHHHIHLHPQLLPIVCRLAREYGLPIRPLPFGADTGHYGEVFNELKTVKHPGVCLTDFYADGVREEFFTDFLSVYPDLADETVELMCHPAYVDDIILTQSSYNFDRVKELRVLKSARVKDWVKNNDVELINYKQI